MDPSRIAYIALVVAALDSDSSSLVSLDDIAMVKELKLGAWAEASGEIAASSLGLILCIWAMCRPQSGWMHWALFLTFVSCALAIVGSAFLFNWDKQDLDSDWKAAGDWCIALSKVAHPLVTSFLLPNT